VVLSARKGDATVRLHLAGGSFNAIVDDRQLALLSLCASIIGSCHGSW
jgi:hypothetical protein